MGIPQAHFLSFSRPRVKLWITAFWFLFGRPCQGGWTPVHWFWLILWSLLDFDLLCSGASWKTFGGLENNSPEGKIKFNLPILFEIEVCLNNILIIVSKSSNTFFWEMIEQGKPRLLWRWQWPLSWPDPQSQTPGVVGSGWFQLYIRHLISTLIAEIKRYTPKYIGYKMTISHWQGSFWWKSCQTWWRAHVVHEWQEASLKKN